MIIDTGHIRFAAVGCIDLSDHRYVSGAQRLSVSRRDTIGADWLEDRRRQAVRWMRDIDPTATVSLTPIARTSTETGMDAGVLAIEGNGVVSSCLLAALRLSQPVPAGVAEVSLLVNGSGASAWHLLEAFLASVSRQDMVGPAQRAGGHLAFTVPAGFTLRSKAFSFWLPDPSVWFHVSDPATTPALALDSLVVATGDVSTLREGAYPGRLSSPGLRGVQREVALEGRLRGATQADPADMRQPIVSNELLLSAPGEASVQIVAAGARERRAAISAAIDAVAATLEWRSS